MALPPDLENLKHRPAMMGVRNFREAAAFLVGFDSATMGGLLAGFREWLVVRANGGNNLAFVGLVEMLMAKSPPVGDDRDRAEIEYLMATLDEFLTERSEWDALRRIYAKHQNWLRKQSWYRPENPD